MIYIKNTLIRNSIYLLEDTYNGYDMSTSTLIDMQYKSKFQFSNHPWISLFTLMFLVPIMMIVAAIFGMIKYNYLFYHGLLLFVIVPYFMRIPNENRIYKEYLSDIRLTHFKPLSHLFLIGVSSWIILGLCQAMGSVVYAISQDEVIDLSFIKYIFDFSVDLPPKSNNFYDAIPSMFEEVAWRGVILTLFMRYYSKKKSIAISSIGFGFMHILNLENGRELNWVIGQIIWTAILGIFYSYIVLKTDSILPAMLVHWLSNAFVYTFTRYIQINASSNTYAMYNLIFSFGLIPTLLMILWVRFYANRWLVKTNS